MNDDEDILKRAEKLLAAEDKLSEARAKNPFSAFFEKIYQKSVFIQRIVATARVVWQDYLWPISRILNPPLRGYWWCCKKVFNKISFNANGEYVTKRGAFAFVLLSIFTIFFGYTFVTRAIPTAARFAYDAVAINLTSKEAIMVFSQPNPVVDRPGELAVYACRKYPCEAQIDSIEFRMRDSVYLDALSFLKHFQPHDPGELAGAFVSEENGCKIRYYSRRMKYLGFYPYITHAICRPINGSNSTEILDGLKSMKLR